MFTATSTGIDQTSTSPVVSSSRMNAPSWASSSAISVPSTIVSATVAAVNAIVRAEHRPELRGRWRILV